MDANRLHKPITVGRIYRLHVFLLTLYYQKAHNGTRENINNKNAKFVINLLTTYLQNATIKQLSINTGFPTRELFDNDKYSKSGKAFVSIHKKSIQSAPAAERCWGDFYST